MSRERIEKHDFYELVVKSQFSERAADVPGLALLTQHVYGYVGEKNYGISHMSATASLITQPAIYTL